MPLIIGDDKIKSIYVGDQKIKKAYLGDELVYQAKTGGIVLPNGYTALEYIDTGDSGNGDHAYIKNGPSVINNFRIVCDMEVVVSNSRINFWSIREWPTNSGELYVIYIPSQLKIKDYASSSKNTEGVLFSGDILNKRLIIDVNYPSSQTNFTAQINEDNIITIKKSYASTTKSKILSIPSYTTSSNGILRIFEFKVYNDDILSCDLVPAKDERSIAGLYDIVTNNFYSSYVTNCDFIAGPEV